MTLYDQLAILLQLLREALYVCLAYGRLRTVEGTGFELLLLFQMIEALDCTMISKTLKLIQIYIRLRAFMGSPLRLNIARPSSYDKTIGDIQPCQSGRTQSRR